CTAMPPNVPLLTAKVLRPFSALTSGLFSRFSISILICADFDPNWKVLPKDASRFAWRGDRRSVRVRGALPNVFGGASEDAERVRGGTREPRGVPPGGVGMLGGREPVFERAGGRQVDTRDEIRALHAATQQAGVVALDDRQREAALDVERRHDQPAAGDPVD